MIITIQQITITKAAASKGTAIIAYNVDLNGKPFGQMYSYKTDLSRAWHAKALNGAYKLCDTRKSAELFLRGAM